MYSLVIPAHNEAKNLQKLLKKAYSVLKKTKDGDLSHDPAEIVNFLKFLKDYDMVCGSRYTKGGKAEMTHSRILVSSLFNLVFRNLLGIPVKDFTSGFRAYKAKIIDKIELKSKKFGIFIEIPLKAHLAGFKLTEIPISY